jgi:hypothetical protein
MLMPGAQPGQAQTFMIADAPATAKRIRPSRLWLGTVPFAVEF